MDAGTPSDSRADAAFARLGPQGAPTPLVIAVPHAGRHYPAGLLAQSRLPRSALETIEDRHADLLIETAVGAGAVAIVARTARALVDLNRDPREIDTTIVRGGGAGLEAMASVKVAGGLGVVPSRIASGGAVWRRPLEPAEIARRIETVHTPYHAAIDAALDAAQAAHGVAILIDCHSMPPLGPDAARIVLGDRHGASADARFVRAAARAIGQRGLTLDINRPYPGGYTLTRHARPAYGRHAMQIEVDRALYLYAALRDPAAGLAAARTLIAAVARALLDEARLGGADTFALAAE